jgi:SAM-dependent methyltransferase
MSSVLADVWSIMRFYGRNIVRNTAQNLLSCSKSVSKTLREHYRYERPLGVHTTGYVYRKKGDAEANAFRDDVLYEPTGYDKLEQIMRLMPPRPGDVVMDFGCGKGRAVAFFATKGVKKSMGIEFRPELVEIARANGASLRGRTSEIEVLQGDFLKVDLDAVTYFFMYNPAGEKTLKALAARMEESLARAPRPIRLAYVFPICGQVFDDCAFLTRVPHDAGTDLGLWQGGAAPGTDRPA